MAESSDGDESMAGGVDDDLGSLKSFSTRTEPSKCLLDVVHASLSDGDLKTAERLSAFTDDSELDPDCDILVGGFIVRLGKRPLLKQKFHLKLQIERNLDKAFCNQVPGFYL